MNGSADYLPMIADCERALGHPERALRLAKDPAVELLDQTGRAEMVIVAAGARRDQGQPDAAIALLEAAPLTSRVRAPWVARLRYAYADVLLGAGRADEAEEWFHRSAAVDSDGATDALDRLAELNGSVIEDTTEGAVADDSSD